MWALPELEECHGEHPGYRKAEVFRLLVLRIADALGRKQASAQKDEYRGGAGSFCFCDPLRGPTQIKNSTNPWRCLFVRRLSSFRPELHPVGGVVPSSGMARFSGRPQVDPVLTVVTGFRHVFYVASAFNNNGD